MAGVWGESGSLAALIIPCRRAIATKKAMHQNSKTGPVETPILSAGQIVFPALRKLIAANEAARAKRLRRLAVVHQHQLEVETGRHWQGGEA
jgi:hypothetical protein